MVGFLVMAGASISSVFYYQTQRAGLQSKREADTQVMVREAELQKLQLQLQPHFLFNSLNSINAMILNKPDQAMNMIQHLSDFLRITTKRADQHWVRFSEEWEYLQLYLSIERVRFGHRLEIVSSIGENVSEWKIPTLILQPLVENAIKFGLYGTTEAVKITFSAVIENGMMILELSNPFEEDSQPQKGSGFGLNGLQRRLYLLYARNDLLKTQVENNYFIVELKLPQQ
jgi:LytS/YehU family sensor histidine kinase